MVLSFGTLDVSNFFLRAIFVGCEQFFADVSSKIIALADPVLSQPDMEWEMVSPPAGVYIPSFTICHVLPDRLGRSGPARSSGFD
jgi:hypothetical protein